MISRLAERGSREHENLPHSGTDSRDLFLIPEITFYRIRNLQGLSFASRAC